MHQTAVGKVAADVRQQVAGGAQGAGVIEVAAGDQVDVRAGNQRTVGCQAVVCLGQVQHRHQHLLPGDGGVFQPHDVVGQGGDLFGGEAHAHGQIQGAFAADGVVHQVLEQVGVAGLAIDKPLAGTREYGLLDKALFVEAVTQATLRGVGVVAELGEHVVRAHELTHISEQRVGFNQVFVRVGRKLAGGQPGRTVFIVEVEQAVFAGGQVEAGQAQWVDLLLGNVRRQLWVELDLGRVARRLGVGAAADVGVATLHDVVVDAGLSLHVNGAARLDHGGVALVRRHQLGGFAQSGFFALHFADERGHGGFNAVHVVTRRITLGKGGRLAVPASRPALALGGKDAVVLGVVGHQADVAQLVDAHGHGAAGSDATAAVEQRAAGEQHIGARGNTGAGRGVGDDKTIALGDLERAVLLAAFTVAARHAVDTRGGRNGRAVDAGRGGEHGADVFERAGRQDQVALALDRSRAVDDAAGQAALAVAVDTQVAHGVDRGAEVFQAVDLQVHVAAAEDQPVVIEQVAHRQVEAALAGDGAAHGPVPADADQAASAEQFAGGGLVEGVDIDRQAPGLDRGAVGPVGLFKGQVAVGHQAAADVVQADAAEVERAGAGVQHRATGVLEGSSGEAQLVVGRLQTAAVCEHAPDGVTGFAAAAQGAHLPAVVEAGGGDIERRGAFDQATVGQRAIEFDLDLVAGDLATVIHIQAGKPYAITGKQRAVAVVEISGVNLRITGFGGDAPAVVVEGTGRDGYAGLFAVDQTVGAVLQQAGGGECQATAGGQGAFVPVVDAVGEQGQQTLAGELAALVVNVGRALDQQRPGAGQLAVAIDQVADQVQGDCTATGEAAGAVVQGVAVEGKGTGAVDDAALAVVQQAADGEGLHAVAEQSTFVAVIDAVGSNVQHLFGVQGAALVVQGGGGDVELAIGDHRAGVTDVLAIKLDVAEGVAGVVGVDPGLDDAVVDQLAFAGQGDVVARGERLAVFQFAFGLRRERGARVDGAVGFQAGRLDIHRAAGRGLGHAQVAVGIQLNIAAAGGQRAVEFHAHAGFGAHQFDRPGVHAAQGR
ncbi:hypothetical protein [Pseudomonas sp. 22 E 5]|nr:hypothetical protein [Pseudomonas sp. 22 E 5]